VNERPVRIVVDDDLRRSRLTVFFRLLLAIPHFFWITLWTIGVFFTAIAQWFVCVVRGRPARPLHGFHEAYVRYATHLGAYLVLAANPYPGFLGDPGYPIDVEIDAVERQRRVTAGFRFFVALPALLMLGIINGGGAGGASNTAVFSAGIVLTVAFLGWFVCLVRGAMPHGMRNVQAYGLRYTAEVYAYLLLLTDTYPGSDPTLPSEAGSPPAHPLQLDVTDDRRRSRLTTLFRLFLAIPHFVWLLLWSVPALLAAIAQGFFTLFAGRPAAPLFRFLSAFIRYQTHVGAFVMLVANPFPGFTGRPGYPIDVLVAPPERQNRWITGFRLLLAIPALILNGALGGLLLAAGIGGWFAALAIGRTPLGLRNAGAHALRYGAQTNGYLLLLTDRYPFSGPPALQPPEPEPEPEPEAPVRERGPGEGFWGNREVPPAGAA
jgi:hypothetical protein